MMYLIVGKTSTGKDTLAKHLSSTDSGLNIKPCVSYSTREMRESDINGINHFFVSNEQMDEIEKSDSILAYTKNKETGVRYCLPASELSQRNVSFIVNPEGINWMKENCPLAESEYRTIYMDLDEDTIKQRATGRGDDIETVNKRLNSEREEFDGFLKDNADKMLVINAGDDIKTVYEKVEAFIKAEGNYHLEKEPIEYKFGNLDEALDRLKAGEVTDLKDIREIKDAFKLNVAMMKEPEREIEGSDIELMIEKYEQLYDEEYNDLGYNLGDIKMALRDENNVRVPEVKTEDANVQLEFEYNPVSRKVVINIEDEDEHILASSEKDYDQFIEQNYQEFSNDLVEIGKNHNIKFTEMKLAREKEERIKEYNKEFNEKQEPSFEEEIMELF